MAFNLDSETMKGLIDRFGGKDAAEVDQMIAAVRERSNKPDYSQLSQLPPINVISEKAAMQSKETQIS